MDVLTPVVPQQQWHPNYRVLMTPEFADAERSVIANWANGFADRDGKFAKEFQTTFNSSFWELYLHAAFRKLGCTFDFAHHRPDFVLALQTGQEVIAEAVIGSHPQGHRPEWDRPFDCLDDLDRDDVLQLATIRIANAIWSKYQKYRTEYCTLSHVQSKPFVICVAPFEQALFFVQNDNALRRVLYAVDQPLWIDSANGEHIVVGEASMDEVKKDNGSPIPLGFFVARRMPEVSAVIFSNTATFTKVRALASSGRVPVLFTAVRYNAYSPKPKMISAWRPDYQETLLDGMHVCINPFATYPMDLRSFAGREIAVHGLDSEGGGYRVDSPDGFLFQHGGVSLVQRTTVEVAPTIAPLEYKRPTKPQWPEGELRPASGYVGPFVENHLAHYRGWTVLVARDSIDNDWSSQAIRGLHRSLAGYHRADKQGDFLLADEWFETKEAAFQAMLGEVDEHLGARSEANPQ